MTTFLNKLNECHFYKNSLPEVNEYVIGKTTRIEDFGVFVTLPEYNNIEGMILNNEISRRKIRSIKKYLRLNQLYVLQVIAIEGEYINLSKKYVAEDDIKECNEKYKKAKLTHSIMGNIALSGNLPLKKVLEQIAWPLYDEYEHAYDGLEKIVLNNNCENILPIDKTLKDILLKELNHKIKKPQCTVRAQIAVTCFAEGGVDAIISSLKSGKVLPDGTELNIHLLKSPYYVIQYTCSDGDLGLEKVNNSINRIKNQIESEGGKLVVDKEPVITTVSS